MNWSEKLESNPKFIERDLEDEIVLMSQNGTEIHSFEDTALVVWKLIKKGYTPDKIITSIKEEYEVDEDLARQDLSAFVVDLKHKGIIK